jgi:hypothetical protein
MDQAPASTANHALEACERMLRPIMRLALDRGLKYQDIDELIRSLMLDEAARDWAKRNGKEPSGSQLSVTTGINRKEVRRLAGAENFRGSKQSDQSLASVVFMAWRLKVEADPAYQTLPVTGAESNALSFERLARDAVKDVHYRSLLDELVRLRLVLEEDGKVSLAAKDFVPPGASAELMRFIGVNASAHLAAAASNSAAIAAPFLEQAVDVTHISAEHCDELHLLARQSWEHARNTLLSRMTALPEANSNPCQMRVGMYAYFEHMQSGSKESI